MNLQLHWVLLVLLGAQPQEIWGVENCRTPMSQPCANSHLDPGTITQ